MKMNSKKRIPIFILAVMATGLFFFLFYLLFQIDDNDLEVVKFNDGWTENYNGRITENVNIRDLDYPNLKEGDILILKNYLPEDIDNSVTVSFTTILSLADVKVGDETIYTYGYEEYSKNRMVGSGKQIVSLPASSAGKSIEVKMQVCEDNAFTSLGDFEYGRMSSIFFGYMKYNMINIVVCIFLVMLGFIITVVSAGSLLLGNEYLRVIPVGIFSFIMGLYGLCGKSIFVLCGANLSINTACEYITLYLFPAAIIFIVASNMKKDTKSFTFMIALGILWVVFSVSAIVLHFTNKLHFPSILSFFHVLAFISVIIAVLLISYNVKKYPKKNRLSMVGFAIMGICELLDVIFFNIQKYYIPTFSLVRYSFAVIGALLLIVLLLISYMANVYQVEVEQTEKRLLAKLAYVDDLCQIYNRTKCNEDFKKFNNSTEEYALINFDLNGLKNVNDNKGHTYGDLLIKEFAAVLTDCFDDVGIVYRIGGDEFLVFIPENKMDKIDGCINNLDRLEQAHGEIAGLDINASYGVAYSYEVPAEVREVQKVYAVADRRMYEMKKIYHEENGTELR